MERLPNFIFFKNLLFSEGISLSSVFFFFIYFPFPCLLDIIISILLCYMQSAWLFVGKSFSPLWHENNFNFCYSEMQYYSFSCVLNTNVTEVKKHHWNDGDGLFFIWNLLRPSDVIIKMFPFPPKRYKYIFYKPHSALVFPVQLRCVEIFIQKLKDVKIGNLWRV